MASDDIGKFDKPLERMDAKSDYKNAIRNHMEGDNIAAFVYLRRMVEKYVDYVYEKNKCKIQISKTCFSKKKKKKSTDKISLLEGFVPQMLIDNQKIYSILSLGIHELNEEKCKEYYPSLKEAIDRVLSAELDKMTDRKIRSNIQKILREEKGARKRTK